MDRHPLHHPPEWPFIVTFAFSLLGYLAWVVWYALTQTTAGFR